MFKNHIGFAEAWHGLKNVRFRRQDNAFHWANHSDSSFPFYIFHFMSFSLSLSLFLICLLQSFAGFHIARKDNCTIVIVYKYVTLIKTLHLNLKWSSFSVDLKRTQCSFVLLLNTVHSRPVYMYGALISLGSFALHNGELINKIKGTPSST